MNSNDLCWHFWLGFPLFCGHDFCAARSICVIGQQKHLFTQSILYVNLLSTQQQPGSNRTVCAFSFFFRTGFVAIGVANEVETMLELEKTRAPQTGLNALKWSAWVWWTMHKKHRKNTAECLANDLSNNFAAAFGASLARAVGRHFFGWMNDASNDKLG